MAGTLTISTLSDGTNSTSSTNCILGSAKAWVKFQGGNGNTAGTINGSYNVSSITVNGTGDYTINYTNAFADTNYSLVGTSKPATAQSTQSSVKTLMGYYNATYTTSLSRIVTCTSGVGTENCESVHIAVFR